jgi:hypothetical protein
MTVWLEVKVRGLLGKLVGMEGERITTTDGVLMGKLVGQLQEVEK